MKNLSFLILVSIAAIFTCTTHAEPGRQGPYVYTYGGDPSNVSTKIINPDLGSFVIDPNTGNRYLKASAKGNNSAYGTSEIIMSGSQINLQANTAATDTLTFVAAPTAGETITVGTTSYTFVAANTGTAAGYNQIVISGTATTATNTAAALGNSGSAAGYYTSAAGPATGTASGGVVTLSATAVGVLGNGLATTETMVNPGNVFSNTSMSGGYTQPTNVASIALPANGGKYNLTSADIIYVSGTCPAGATSVAIYSGTTAALTGTTALATGTGSASSYTHISANTTGTVLNTGTTGLSINFNITTGGTSTLPYVVQPVYRFYRVPNL